MRKEVFILLVVVALAGLVSAAGLAEISSLPDEIIACENTPLAYGFEITSAESEIFDVGIYPIDEFFVEKISDKGYEVYSNNLSKDDVRNYEKTVYARNSVGLTYQRVNIRVLEKNNAPEIEELKVKTLSTDVTQSFSQVVFASDIEEGTSADGKLEFVVNFKSGRPIFEVNNNGLIQFDANAQAIGVYLIEICVRDKGLLNLDPRSAICDETGEQKIACEDFQLTITGKNRPPTAVTSKPSETINTTAGKNLNFSLTTFDPDGTAADVSWYVDGTLKEYDEGISSLEKSFVHKFKCSEAGMHEVRADVSDGIDIDRVFWRVYVAQEKNCVDPLPPISSCDEKWACGEWSACQHAEQSVQFGTLPNEEYQNILIDCNSLGISQEKCGFQIRNCEDVYSCGKQEEKPDEMQACGFSLNPSCSDELKNCHDGSCEIEVDCGGSCGECPSCFDDIRNQNEEKVDCGGVCNACIAEDTAARNSILSKIAVGIIVILVILLLFKIFSVVKTERELGRNG